MKKPPKTARRKKPVKIIFNPCDLPHTVVSAMGKSFRYSGVKYVGTGFKFIPAVDKKGVRSIKIEIQGSESPLLKGRK